MSNYQGRFELDKRFLQSDYYRKVLATIGEEVTELVDRVIDQPLVLPASADYLRSTPNAITAVHIRANDTIPMDLEAIRGGI